MTGFSDKWDREEKEDADLFDGFEELTTLEILYRMRAHVIGSGRYSDKDKIGLLKALMRDIDRVAGC